MAKISANGAGEICRVQATSPAEYQYLLVMCSDGRVLIRPADGSEGYRVLIKNIKVQYRNMDGMRRLCKIRNMTITHEGRSGRLTPVKPGTFGNDFCYIAPEEFSSGDSGLYYMSIRRNVSQSIAISSLTKGQLKAIRDVIDGFLEEE